MRKGTILVSAAVIAAAVAVATAAGAGSGVILGPVTHTSQPTFQGYYDAHKDGYLITDVSSKAQAKAWHVNFSAEIGTVKGAPRQFFVQGKAAAGQLSVFGSEPGEKDYNPLWEEILVTWKAGATPVLLTSDNQIDGLAKSGKLTEKDLHIVDNAPILTVGK